MEGDAVRYDEAYDDMKGKSMANNVTGGTGGSGFGGGKGKGGFGEALEVVVASAKVAAKVEVLVSAVV